MSSSQSCNALVARLPERRDRTLALVLVRRLAAHGAQDSRAVMLALDAAGPAARKILLQARCLIIELARNSRRRIVLAPCCAPGMTRDEVLLIGLLDGDGLDAHAALTDDAHCASAMSAALLLGETLDTLALRRGWAT